eukprot:CAMPEP_0119006608 /NCGR_PEP_ID=MMETSP1176-20130426/2410_1 /TAXON_ID=265551 /ORGANISM="Synedropsis recta cf, Strain CCMP1620" /LENGTH=199 /DNA_ID=CAMNT_0006958551 /DNA_START=123 /DNA_END=719 /DNA_ORIENTATION=+
MTRARCSDTQELRYSLLYARDGRICEGDKYFVPMTSIKFPTEWENVESRIFPNIQAWKNHAASLGGDKSKAAHDLCICILPFLAEVVVQDGIYWIDAFPDHPISAFILRVMPTNYKLWARDQQRILLKEHTCKKSRVRELNPAVQASYDNVHAEQSVIRREQEEQKERTEKVLANQHMLIGMMQCGQPAATLSPLVNPN